MPLSCLSLCCAHCRMLPWLFWCLAVGRGSVGAWRWDAEAPFHHLFRAVVVGSPWWLSRLVSVVVGSPRSLRVGHGRMRCRVGSSRAAVRRRGIIRGHTDVPISSGSTRSFVDSCGCNFFGRQGCIMNFLSDVAEDW